MSSRYTPSDFEQMEISLYEVMNDISYCRLRLEQMKRSIDLFLGNIHKLKQEAKAEAAEAEA